MGGHRIAARRKGTGNTQQTKAVGVRDAAKKTQTKKEDSL